MLRAAGAQPTTDGRSITGMMCPRMLATPKTCFGEPGMGVTGGMIRASRTLKTFMPKVSRVFEFRSSPRRKISSSNLLVPARFERSSTSCMTSIMCGLLVLLAADGGVEFVQLADDLLLD